VSGVGGVTPATRRRIGDVATQRGVGRRLVAMVLVVHGVGERKGAGWLKMVANKWAPLGEIQMNSKSNLIQTWFAPKRTFQGSKNLNPNTGR
jgi:hypothetical protein